MAAREAAIKLTLNGGSFVSSMNQVMTGAEARTRQAGSSMKNALSSTFKGGLGAAGEGMKGALRDLGGAARNALSMGATLGGSVGFGMLLKGAIDYREKLRDIEFQINKNGKASVTWQELQSTVNEAVESTGQKSDELAGAIESVFGATGNADYAIESVFAIGHAAAASGKSVESMANVASVLQRKFGADISTLPEMLATFVEKTDAGGMSLDALGGKFGLLAGEAAEAGFSGSAGLTQLLSMIENLDSRVGEKAEPAMKKLFQTLKDGSASMKRLSKETQLKFEPNMTAMDKIKRILGSDKGRKVMIEMLGGESRVVFDELAKPFEEAFSAAKEEGLKSKEATAAGLAAFDASIEKLGNRTLTFGNILDESAKSLKEDPGVKLRLAIEKMQAAFTKPEMLEVIDRLSDSLPSLGKGVTDAMEFVTRRPKTAAAMVIGAKIGLAGLEGIGAKVGQNLAEKMSAGASSAAATFAARVAADGGWAKAAGQFGLIAGAAFAATEIGKSLIDKAMGEDEQKKDALADATSTAASMAAHGTGTEEQRKAAAAELRTKISAMEESGGPGLTTKLFGSMANFFDESVEHPMTAFTKQLDTARAALAELEGSPGKTREANDKLARAAMAAAGALERIGNAAAPYEAPPGDPTGSSKGPPRPGNRNTPGHAL